MAALPPLQVFRDIAVVPVQSVAQHVARGGPIWPEFDTQVMPRHCRDRLPVDICPAPAGAGTVLHTPALWGGFLNPQFGHLIVEQLTRLPQSLAERPGDLILFTLPPRGSAQPPPVQTLPAPTPPAPTPPAPAPPVQTPPAPTQAAPTPPAPTLPDWIWQMLDWHGLRRDRVRLVDAPLRVAELRVAAQGEMMGTDATCGAYLDLLDRNTARQALTPAPSEMVFVTRAGLVANGQGGHAGEACLAAALRRSGAQVVDPATLPVRRQLEIYAGARVLVFSEGSAIHGRLLLGRATQDIHILRRRPRRDLAAQQLSPRCTRLRYHAAVGHRLGARMPGGANRLDLTAAIYDLQVVFDLFASLGHDLRPHWDLAAYHAAVVDDLRGWLAACKTDAEQVLANLALVRAAGFDLDRPFSLSPRAAPARP